MLAGLTDISLPDVASVEETARELGAPVGLLGVGAGVAAAGACVSPAAPLASVVLPAVASTYAEESMTRFAGSVDERLRGLADQYDGDDRRRAALAKCSRGCSKVLDPLVPEDSDAGDAAELAENDPEAFETLIRRVFESDPEELERVEADLRAVLAADPAADTDPAAVVQRVRDTFGVDSTQEAVRLLQMYHTFLGDVRTAADGSDDPEVRETLGRLDDCLAAMAATTDDVLETLLRVELEDRQGFRQWTVGTLHRKRPFERTDPRDVWGFGQLGLPELVAAEDPDHEFTVGDIRAGEGDPPFRREVVDRLGDGDPVVVTAGPECGKSTVCKRVAHEWVDRDRGTVFYRDTDTARRPFTGVRALLSAVEEAQDVGDGTPLVVVEDATREGARAVFEAIDRSVEDERDVAVLLDARTSEWEAFERETDSEVVDPEFGESPLVRLPMPELSVATCRSAVEAFNQLPGAYYGGPDDPAGRLHETVTERTPDDRRAYELSTLSTVLRQEGLDSERTPLADSGRDAYEAVVGPVEDEIATVDDVTDPADPAKTRRALVATGINLLNAAEHPVEPESLLGLAFVDPAVEEGTPEELRPAVGAIVDSLTDPPGETGFNRQIVRTDAETVTLAPLETRPPSWSASFLERGLEGPGEHAVQPLVTVAGAAMLGLADEVRADVPGLAGESGERRRAALNRVLRYYADRDRVAAPEDRDRYLAALDAEPAATAEDLLTTVYDWAQRGLNGPETGSWRRELLQPGVDALTDPGESDEGDDLGSLDGDDDVGSPVGLDGDGEFGSLDDPRLHDVVPACCSPGLGADLRCKLVWGDGVETASERVEALERERQTAGDQGTSEEFARAYTTLGRRTRDDDAEEAYYRAAIDRYETLGEDAWVGHVYQDLALENEARDPEAAERYYREAAGRYDAAGEDRLAALTYSRTAELYTGTGHGEQNLSLAEEYHRKALDRTAAVDDRAVADIHLEAAKTFEASDGEAAEEHYRAALNRYEALGDDERVAVTYAHMAGLYAGRPFMAAVSGRRGTAKRTDETRAMEYFEAAIERYDEQGSEDGVVNVAQEMAASCGTEGRETAVAYYRQIAARHDEAGNERNAARMYSNAAELYEQTDIERAEGLYLEAIDRLESLGDERGVALRYRKLARQYEALDTATAQKYYRAAIENYETANDGQSAARTYARLAALYGADQVDDARECYRQAVEWAPGVEDVAHPTRQWVELEVDAGEHQAAVDIAEDLLDGLLAAVEDDDLSPVLYDDRASAVTRVLETVATAAAGDTTLPTGFVERADRFLAATADDVDDQTREEYRAAVERLPTADGGKR